MGTIDDNGNIHGAAGTQGAGQFQQKTNTPPASGLAEPGGRLNPGERKGASLHRGSFGSYTVTNVRTYQGMEGEGFSATLVNDGVKVGHIVQAGDGGATYCRFNSGDDRAAFDHLVAAEWDFDRTYSNPGGGTFTFPCDQETVLDAIVEESQVREMLNRSRKSGQVPVMLADDVDNVDKHDTVAGYVTIGCGEPPAPNRAEIADHLREMDAVDGALYWDGETWRACDGEA